MPLRGRAQLLDTVLQLPDQLLAPTGREAGTQLSSADNIRHLLQGAETGRGLEPFHVIDAVRPTGIGGGWRLLLI